MTFPTTAFRSQTASRCRYREKTYYGLPTDDRARSSTNIVTAKLEHDLGAGLTLTDTFRYGHYWFDYRETAPQFGPPCSAPTLPLSDDFVCRDRPSAAGTITTLMNEPDLTYLFRTVPSRTP